MNIVLYALKSLDREQNSQALSQCSASENISMLNLYFASNTHTGV